MSKLLKLEGIETPKNSAKTEKVNKKYADGLNKVYQDLHKIKERQEESKKTIQQYREELAVKGLDVAIIQDEGKRKELLKRREVLQDLIKEEELYLELDYDAYKQRVIEENNLDDLRYHAGREYRLLSLQVDEYTKALKEELERSQRLAIAMREQDNEYLQLLHKHGHLTGNSYIRWEAPRE